MPPLNPIQRSIVALAFSNAALATSNAATITVGTTDGGIPADGTCSLHEAIVSANNDAALSNSGCIAGNGADEIVFSDAVFASASTITLSSALPKLTGDLTISGTDVGLTIDGNNSVRVIDSYNSNIVLDKLIVSGGLADKGGGIRVQGSADGSTMSLTITNSTITNNTASERSSGGGLYVEDSLVSIENSIIEANEASSGGGIQVIDASVLTIKNSVLSGNNTDGFAGAAIYAISSVTSPLTFSMSNSEVSNNKGSGVVYGGALRFFHFRSNLYATINNTTISGNSSVSQGGGINSKNDFFSTDDNATTFLTIRNSTIVNNAAEEGAGVLLASDSVISNSILSGNLSGSPVDVYIDGTPNVTAENSIFGSSTLSTNQSLGNFRPDDSNVLATSDSDNIAVESILNPILADNGCVTPAGAPSVSRCVKTHALVTGSPAIDAAKAASCSEIDQIGNQRDSESFFVVTKTNNDKVVAFSLGEDITCDIGAVQFTGIH